MSTRYRLISAALVVLGVTYAPVVSLQKTIKSTNETTLSSLRHSRQEEGVAAAAGAAGEAANEVGYLYGTYANVGQIINGVFQGDVRPILAGGAAFIPEGGVRDGVSTILQQSVAPQVEKIFKAVGNNLQNRINNLTGVVPETTHQPQQQQQIFSGGQQSSNPNFNGNYNPYNNNNHLIPDNAYNNNNFNQNYDAYQNNNFNSNFNGYENNNLNPNFNGYNTNLNQQNYNNVYNNNNLVKTSNIQNQITTIPPSNQNQNGNNNENGGIHLPNPLQLIRDRLSGNNSGSPNPIQLIRDTLTGSGGNRGSPNPIQLLHERLNGGGNNGTATNPLLAIQQRIQSLLGGGGDKNSQQNYLNNVNREHQSRYDIDIPHSPKD